MPAVRWRHRAAEGHNLPRLQPGDPLTTPLRAAAGAVLDALERSNGPRPYSGIDHEALRAGIEALDPLPDEGLGLEAALREIEEAVLANGLRVADPRAAAHLHAPPLPVAAAAELAIGATNQSMDSFDQAPAATFVEDRLVRRLAHLFGLPSAASGVMTAGGTASNLLGLMLAREHATLRAGARLEDGLPEGSRDWRIVASEAAHFSVRRAAAVLGLGERAVVTVPVDRRGRMDTAALERALDGLEAIALVGTAGTTDLGAIDPLEQLAGRSVWLHVDAALGAGLAVSDELRPRLAGIERADSVTADLHKLLWQPIGASVLLVRDAKLLDVVSHHSDYLHRPEDEGQLNLVSRSLDTSRRFDALKVLLSFRAAGRRNLAAMVEHLVATAAYAARRIDEHPDLELLAEPSTVTVVFRRRARDPDRVNTAIQRGLFERGEAAIGRTRLDGAVALKLTFVNPLVTAATVDELLALISGEGTDRR